MGVIKPEEIARRLEKSLSWVYANAHHLGGAKIGGSWIFEEEEVENALQRGRQMERSGHGGRTAKNKAVRHQKGRKRLGGGRKEEVEKLSADIRRHGLECFLYSLSQLCGGEETFKKNLCGEADFGKTDL